MDERLKMKKVLIMLLALLVLSGSACNISTIVPAQDDLSNKEEIMEEPLLTKEEFLRRVSENEEALGVTIADFNDIDVDDFIEFRKLTETDLEAFIAGRRIFSAVFESYVSGIERRRVLKYAERELTVKDSTDEEFEEFKAVFFESIGGVTEATSSQRESVVGNEFIQWYSFQAGEATLVLIIGRTMDIEHLESNGWVFSGNSLHVWMPFHIPAGNVFFISRNGKFFVEFGNLNSSLEAVDAFMAIED